MPLTPFERLVLKGLIAIIKLHFQVNMPSLEPIMNTLGELEEAVKPSDRISTNHS